VLQRVRADNGVVFYQSPLLQSAGVKHGFSTRIGGVSVGPFASLNLGNPSGDVRDPWENVLENHRRLFQAIGITPRQRLSCHQVHGTTVQVFRGGDWPEPQPQGDAIITDDPTVVATVRVADCVPVLLSSRDGRLVAAVHAGWRGVVAGVLPEAVEAMVRLGTDPRDIFAAIGPSIGLGAFEVGPEVVAEFVAVFPEPALVHGLPGGKSRLDLRAALVSSLRRCGVPETQVDTTDRCTFRDADEFFSHRRERGITGRMSAVIAARDRR
jgi:YfiH family protein